MPIPPRPGARLARADQLARLKTARWILWILGVLTIVVMGFQLANLESTLDAEIERQLRGTGATLEEVRNLSPAERAEFDEAYAEGLTLARILGWIALGIGVVFLVCGTLVFQKPVPATLTGLILYALSLVAGIVLDPSTWFHGVLIKGLMLAGLITAVRAAYAYERMRSESLDEATVRATF